ncbi:SusC/RagA family TonB-linked outer membrane protein [Flavobacterium collinsii]|uniref:SusC/RagA family TonB-linked outer membrane protein n=1 Tax=Flavobacterium collinsii TaxID=1114861 RepID=UPI0022C56FAD|nr:TonB-dependent receptor [Flavobacterium collinsii]GIQ57137.1 SusC/RagA family TonB-linked outer membrane protein [Flavobacterium collinsii]
MKRTLFLFLLLTTCKVMYGQDIITVKGVVTDAQNMPLPGATVSEKGTKNATVTAMDGDYQIKVKPNAVLVFSFIGTKSKEEAVKSRTLINTKLLDDANNLDEVVVVGYGTKTRKNLTGAISSVKGTEIAKIPVQDVAQAMQGRIAGLQITMPDGTPGAQPTLRIRGGTSITQSNEPLYVVDGVAQTGGLAFLDPMDIESIDVLKDASSTSIYGAQGANGVILVTTKKSPGGKLKLSYDTYAGIKTIAKTLPVLNPYQYTQLVYESATDDTRMQKYLSTFGTYEEMEGLYKNRPGINWQDEVFGNTVVNQYHKIGISGGENDTKYNAFYSVNNDQGIMLGSESVKNIAKLQVTQAISKRFTVNAIVNYSNQKITGLSTGDGGNARLSMLQTLLQYRPTIGKNGTDDDLKYLLVDPLDNQASPALQSPLITIESQKREAVNRSLNMNLQLSYYLTPKLVYSGLISYTDNSNKSKYFNGADGIQAIRSGGANGGITHNLSTRLNYNNVLTYNNTFSKKHKLSVTAGQEYIYNYSEGITAAASAFPDVNLGWDKLQLGTIAAIPTSFAEDDKLLSFFGKTDYSFKSRYLLSASIRADGSSKFGTENQWGVFPSVSAAWRVIEEDFMKNIPAFSDLKFRLSYGEAGNNRIANYAALGIFNSGSYPLNNQVNITAFQSNLPNPYLKWESTKSTNIGLDLGFFKQRISLTTELYENRSKDLLYNTRVPASSGFKKQFQNIGATSNRGIEFTLNTINVKNNNFSWNTTFNIAFNKTKVLSLSEGETSLITNSYTDKNDYILKVGQPVGVMYGYINDGLYQVNDFDYNATAGTYALKTGVVSDNLAVQPGFIKFKDISGPNGTPDGVINDLDRTAIGDANPKYTGGLNNTFSYKGIDLSVFLDFTVGNDIYNANVLNNSRLNLDNLNTLAIYADRWTTINAAGQRVTDPNELAALNVGKTNPAFNGNTTGRLYSSIIEDGSFLRINNVSLGYTLPKAWLKKSHISNLRIYFTAYNLYVFTKYSGYDPEVSVLNNAITRGVDFSAYPRSKSFITGLNISL